MVVLIFLRAMDVCDGMSTAVEGQKVKQLLIGAVVVVTASCASTQSATKADSATEPQAKATGNIRQSKAGNEKVTEYDLNGDKKSDVWAYSVPGKNAEGRDVDRLLRKEYDLNWDTRVDLARYFNDRDQVERETLDLDFDGKIDQTNFYEKGVIVRKESDLTQAGKTSQWRYYEKGKLVRKERDNNGDGRIDYWEYWEGDQVDRIGEDLDGDGNVDKWTKNPNSES